MPATKCNLSGEYRIEQGCPFEIQITVTDNAGGVYDLVGATCAAQIRERYDSEDYVSFSSSINTSTGVITLSLTSAQTSAIGFTSGVWDCVLTETGDIDTRLLYGSVAVSQEVTR